MKKIRNEIKALEKKIAEFGYGEMQQVSSHSWAEIKKAIMASHKSSPYKSVNIKPMQEKVKYGAGHYGGFAEAYFDIDCQFDSDADPSLHSVTAKVKVSLSIDGLHANVQTRYNQA